MNIMGSRKQTNMFRSCELYNSKIKIHQPVYSIIQNGFKHLQLFNQDSSKMNFVVKMN